MGNDIKKTISYCNDDIQLLSVSDILTKYGRYNFQEGIRFYRISRGSVYELKDHLISCFDLNYIKKEILEKGIVLIEDTKKILNGYIRFINSQKEKQK